MKHSGECFRHHAYVTSGWISFVLKRFKSTFKALEDNKVVAVPPVKYFPRINDQLSKNVIKVYLVQVW